LRRINAAKRASLTIAQGGSPIMRTLHLTALAVAALTLAACAEPGPYYRHGPGPGGPVPPITPAPSTPPPASPLARNFGYICEDLSRISIVEGQPFARLTLNSGLEINLAYTGPGRYGVPPYEFRVSGGDALFINSGKAWRCRAG
jgi:hypothetical protein